MNDLSRQIIRNQVIYYIAAAVICVQGLLCIVQIVDGGRIINYAVQNMYDTYSWDGDTGAWMTAWGTFAGMTGVMALAGFLFAGIAALLRKRILVGVACGVIALSYMLAVMREFCYVYLYRHAGFLFLNIIGLVILVMLALIALADIKSLRRFITSKLLIAMLIPIGLYLLTVIVGVAGTGMGGMSALLNLIENLAQVGLVIVIAVLVSGYEAAAPRYAAGFAEPAPEFAQQSTGGDRVFNTSTSIQPPDGYRSVALVVIFGIITCGIYIWYWVYKISEKVNGELGTGKSPVAQTLLFILVPFYSWYWFYNTAQNLNIFASRKGYRSDSSMPAICLVVTIFGLGIVAVALMQDIMNKAVGEFEGAAYRQAPPQGGPAVQPAPAAQSGPSAQPDTAAQPGSAAQPDSAVQPDSNAGQTPSRAGFSSERPAVTTDVGAGYFYVQPEEPAAPSYETVSEPAAPIYEVVTEPEEPEELAEPEIVEMPAEPEPEADNIFDELRKFKGLLDDGIITQEEFEILKKKLIDQQ